MKIDLPVSPPEPSELYRAIVESSDDAIISKSLDGTIMSWNQGACRIFGYSTAEMLGRSIRSLIPADRVHEEDLILARIRSGETVDHFETQRVRKDGELIHVSVTISPVYDARGAVIGASKIARDISRRVGREQRMRLMDRVFDATSEAIVVTDEQGVVLEVNEAFSEITGYAREDVIGQHPRMLRSGRQAPEVHQDMLQTLLRTGHCQGEVWSRRKSGQAYAVMLSVSEVPDPSQGPRRYVALFADITLLREHQEQIEQLAHYDALTRLPNRLLLTDRLGQAIIKAQRQHSLLAIVYLDLDGFKAVNDERGHDIGDELLIAVAARMQSVVRAGDTVARMGGDEFVLVLCDLESVDHCTQILQRLLLACSEPVAIHGEYSSVSASMGVTLYPLDLSDTDQLLRHADLAMYEAKKAGKNRYQIFDAQEDAAARERAKWLLEFAQALLREELVLHYQPKVHLRTGAVVGAEALVRWQHPVKGLLYPGSFLPKIESHTLLSSLGEWVVERGLRQLAIWNALGVRLVLGVNMAPDHLKQENFATHLLSQIALHPEVDPAQLELEIVESSAISDTQQLKQTLHRCHALGIRFALDDFGTGYSSLTYLRRLEVDTLKIDQSFVRDMLIDDSDLAIVRAVIGLAQAFGREVVAEGVETEAHVQRLLALGCELAQGYGLARPMPAKDFLQWLQARGV